MIAILVKELRAYYNSSMAWVLAACYLFIIGLMFVVSLMAFAPASARMAANPMGAGEVKVMEQLIYPVMWWMAFLLILMVPILTMRLFSEEKRSGTLELLFTYPLTEFQIVMAKFLAALSVVVLMLFFAGGTTVLYTWRLVGVEWPTIGVTALGLVLVGASFVSYGLWASSLSGNQLVAAVVTFAGLFAMWLIQFMRDFVDLVKDKIGDPSSLAHFDNMARGQLSSHDVVYYVAWTALFLFLTMRVLESRKWST